MPVAAREVAIHPRDRNSILFEIGLGRNHLVNAVQLKAYVAIRYVRGDLRPAMRDGYWPREQNDTVMIIAGRQEHHSRIGQGARGLLECRKTPQIKDVRDVQSKIPDKKVKRTVKVIDVIRDMPKAPQTKRTWGDDAANSIASSVNVAVSSLKRVGQQLRSR